MKAACEGNNRSHRQSYYLGVEEGAFHVVMQYFEQVKFVGQAYTMKS